MRQVTTIIENLTTFVNLVQEVCEIAGVDHPYRLRLKLQADKEKAEKVRQQLDTLIQALEVDNWHNALLRIEALQGNSKKPKNPVGRPRKKITSHPETEKLLGARVSPEGVSATKNADEH